jgi:hypothetical protein
MSLLISFYGPWLFGTKFTSRYSDIRFVVGLWCVVSWIIQIIILIYII